MTPLEHGQSDFSPTLAALIEQQAATQPDVPILTFVTVRPDGSLADELRTYRDLARNGAALAGRLKTIGIRPGDRFAIMMYNHPEFVEAMVAASILGACIVPIDPRTMGDKLSYMLAHTNCRGVVCADYCIETLGAAASAVPALDWMVVVGEGPLTPSLHAIPYAEALRAAAAVPGVVDPATPMSFLFTSGTTGHPKAVVQSHVQYMQAANGMRVFGIGAGDVLYTGLSLTHINAQGTLRTGLSLGLPAVISRKFTKSRLWDICRAYNCTVFNLLGGMIPEVFSASPRPDDTDNPVRLIISAGMPVSLWDAYRTRFGLEICEVYGSTEGGGSMFNPPGVGPVGSMGRPAPALEAAVFDGDRRCAPGELGELRFRRNDCVATTITYHANEAASRAKVADGWFRTGDIVHIDAGGWFYFHHRVGGGVRRNGDFVNTALVETAISRSELVDDVFVFGIETEQDVAGEKTLVAMVVPTDLSSFNAETLLAYCRERLERRDVPAIVQVVDAIPKTASEKPIERVCVALVLDLMKARVGGSGAMA